MAWGLRSLWRASAPVSKARNYLPAVAEAVGKARKSMPWPKVETLADGTIQNSGLTDAEMNEHIARIVVAEMAMMGLPSALVDDAAWAICQAESEMLGAPMDRAEFQKAASLYQRAAVTGFRAILREIVRTR